MSTKEGIQKVVDGGRSEVTDEKILSSTHPYEKAMLKALDMCFVYDPEKRPSARAVAELLQRALETLERDA